MSRSLSFVLRPEHEHKAGCGCYFADARVDRTGTSHISKRFERDAVRRFQKIRNLIWQSIVTNDAFGLSHAKPKVARDRMPARIAVSDDAVRPGEFVFRQSKDKVTGFMRWLKEQERKEILGVREGANLESAAEKAWSNLYIANAYQKGITDAGEKLRDAGADVAGSWVEEAFTRPIHADRVGLAYTRTFSELQGITEAMDKAISRELATGLANGANPVQIAREISKKVDSIGIVRARTLARTEVINAHAQATLNGFEEAGIEGVEVEAEWLTAEDACPLCEAAAAGGTYTIAEARGLIPLHPNCRCAWAPKVINGTGIELR